MTATQSDKRIMLIVSLVFGIVATAAGVRWLNTGSIEITSSDVHVGPRASRPPVAGPKQTGPALGRIEAQDLAFYPLCLTWIGLGISMIALPIVAFVTKSELFYRLTAYTGPAILVLGFATVGIAAWYGT